MQNYIIDLNKYNKEAVTIAYRHKKMKSAERIFYNEKSGIKEFKICLIEES